MFPLSCLFLPVGMGLTILCYTLKVDNLFDFTGPLVEGKCPRMNHVHH